MSAPNAKDKRVMTHNINKRRIAEISTAIQKTAVTGKSN